MAVKEVKSIPANIRNKTAEGIGARKELLICDLKKIVVQHIENCEITDVELSETNGKYMLEALIGRWCWNMFGSTEVNCYTLISAFSVIRIKDDSGYKFYIHFEPYIWDEEIKRNGPAVLKYAADNGLIDPKVAGEGSESGDEGWSKDAGT